MRKVRWGAGGRGKRGGARVIYYNQLNDGPIWLRKRFPLADKRESLREDAQHAVEEAPH